MTIPTDKVDMSDTIIFRLRDGFNRFAAEGHGIIIEAGQVFETADAELCKMLDLVPALERGKAAKPAKTTEAENVADTEADAPAETQAEVQS